MGKATKNTTEKKTPYTRKKTTDVKVKKKPLTKSEKLKNADLTENLDNLMDDLTQHLAPKKKKVIQIKNDSMEEVISSMDSIHPKSSLLTLCLD